MRDAPFGLTGIGNGSTNLREDTLLEACIGQQQTNADYISNISTRVANLLQKLRGHGGLRGDCEDAEKREHQGALGEHKLSLDYEAHRLGEIQADLAELERLL